MQPGSGRGHRREQRQRSEGPWAQPGEPENLQKNWLREFYQIVHTHRPHFMALHCQEFGGKNYEASMSHVDKFVKELLSSDAMKEYNRARVYLDENYKSQEHFTGPQLCVVRKEAECQLSSGVCCSGASAPVEWVWGRCPTRWEQVSSDLAPSLFCPCSMVSLLH
nr:PREDICTED: uncharacterized protein LOC103548637 isoform X2 [Equus przewalskii]